MQKTIAAVAVLGLLAGCSQDGPLTAPVDGIVTFGGKPVQHAKVMFFPQKVTNGRIGFAQTNVEGKFSDVRTEGTSGGAVVGSHFVTITEDWPPGQEIPVDKSGMQKSPPRGPWAQKYRDSSSGALKVDVKEGQDNHFEFELSK